VSELLPYQKVLLDGMNKIQKIKEDGKPIQVILKSRDPRPYFKAFRTVKK